MARFPLLLHCTITSTMIQNYQGRVNVTKTKTEVTIIPCYAWYQSSAEGLPSVKGLSASRSNLERCPSSGGDHRHAARLLSRESSEKAHLGCRIYGIKWWLAVKSHAMEEVCMRHLAPATFFVPWSMSLGKATLCSRVNHIMGVPSSYALTPTVSLCSFVGFQRTDGN